MLDVRQQVCQAGELLVIDAGGELTVRIDVVLQPQGNLLEVVLGLHPGGGLADLTDGRQQEAREHREDREHDEQLKQAVAAAGGSLKQGGPPGGARKRRVPGSII